MRTILNTIRQNENKIGLFIGALSFVVIILFVEIECTTPQEKYFKSHFILTETKKSEIKAIRQNEDWEKIFTYISYDNKLNSIQQTKTLDSPYKVINIDKPINSTETEFAPSLTADGKTMVFNSKRNSRYQDIYITHLEGNKWTNPISLQEINSDYNDETPFITPDGSFIFFSSDRDSSYKIPSDDSRQVRVSFDIYVSNNIDGRWDTPIKLPGNVNTANHERSPSLSSDMKTIFYTSMPFGDVKKANIMKAEYVNGEFINPEPLPAPVNTNTQDIGLMPLLDGKGFFFSSRRPGGYGGWDLYYVKSQDGIFEQPINLGSKINSEKNEINFIVVNNGIFFCSDRVERYGLYDIYRLELQK